jgi:hypothetical protein
MGSPRQETKAMEFLLAPGVTGTQIVSNTIAYSVAFHGVALRSILRNDEYVSAADNLIAHNRIFSNGTLPDNAVTPFLREGCGIE